MRQAPPTSTEVMMFRVLIFCNPGKLLQKSVLLHQAYPKFKERERNRERERERKREKERESKRERERARARASEGHVHKASLERRQTCGVLRGSVSRR